MLNAFGISVAPILTALGVGSLAVALALQDSLTSFFAGFYVSLADQIRVSDYVRPESVSTVRLSRPETVRLTSR